MNPQQQAELLALIPVAIWGLILFAMHRWGGAKPWMLAVAVVAGIALSGTMLGPPVHGLLSQIPYLH